MPSPRSPRCPTCGGSEIWSPCSTAPTRQCRSAWTTLTAVRSTPSTPAGCSARRTRWSPATNWAARERPRAPTGKMICGVPELIAYAGAAMTLRPGDVIATGTPAGAGVLTDGDVITLTST
ncbi:fumarylacetoacetate hydrolase family protein [Actinocorallia aurea]